MTHQWTTRWPKPAEAFTEQLVTTTKIPNVRPMSFKLGAFKAFLSSKPLVVVLAFFRNWDWQALVVSVFPVPAGPAGLSWWIVDCFFHMPVFAPHLHITWLDTELEVWSHQPHQSQPCHELPDAPPKNIPRAWDLDGVFGWFLDVFWWNWWNCDILSLRLGEIAPICQSCDDQPKIAALTLPFHLVLLRTSENFEHSKDSNLMHLVSTCALSITPFFATQILVGVNLGAV